MYELVYFKMLLFGSHCFQICRFETSWSCTLTNSIEAGPWEWRNLVPDSISLGAKLLSCRTHGLAVVTQGGHFGLNFTVVPSLVVALVYRSGPTNVWCTGLNMANSVQLVEIEPKTGAKHSWCQWTWWRMSDTMQVYTFCVKKWKAEHLPSTIFDNIRTLNSKQNNQYFAAIFKCSLYDNLIFTPWPWRGIVACLPLLPFVCPLTLPCLRDNS